MPRARFAPALPGSDMGVEHLNVRPSTALPAQLTSFVGREKEIVFVSALLGEPQVRLLTLTGAPGIGKTRLGLRIAERLARCFSDAVLFIPLATVRRADQVNLAIARGIGLRDTAGESLQKSLECYLRDRHLLLLLDNFEQVTAAGSAIARLLAAAPGLKVLVTSRVLLRVYGEHEFKVPTLAVPSAEERSDPDPKALCRLEAVLLFLQRARAADSSFRITQSNAEDIAELCVRLEGLPLAIELAAARARFETPHAMLARMQYEGRNNRLDFLKGGPEDLPDRQRTVRGALAWSYDLLSNSQRRLFRNLAVFEGGFTAEAARHICYPEDVGSSHGKDVLACDRYRADLEELAGASLLCLPGQMATPAGRDDGDFRFMMLETVREYALEHLDESGQARSIRERHALYFAQMAEQLSTFAAHKEDVLRVPSSARRETGQPVGHDAALDLLEREHANMRAAMAWCAGTSFEHGEGSARDIGLRIAIALIPFWRWRGSPREGKEWLSIFLDRDDSCVSPRVRLDSLMWLGHFASNQSDHREAQAIFERTLELSRQQNDGYGTGLSLSALGHQAIHLGEPELAERYYLECLALCAHAENKRGYISSLLNLGDLAAHKGASAHAIHIFEEGLELARQSEDKLMIAASLNRLACMLVDTGDPGKAHALAVEALELQWDRAYKGAVVYSLGLHARIVYALGHTRLAATIFGAASELCKALDMRLEPMLHTDPDEYEKCITALRGMLGAQNFEAAWRKGRGMTMQEAVELALLPHSSARKRAGKERPYAASLTSREIEVLRLVAAGLTNAQAAERLVISPYTVNMHLRSIYGKLGVSSRNAATRYAIENDLE